MSVLLDGSILPSVHTIPSQLTGEGKERVSERLHVSSGEAHYPSPSTKVWEQPSEFYCPVIAALVTGGSHLLCAMLERSVRDRGAISRRWTLTARWLLQPRMADWPPAQEAHTGLKTSKRAVTMPFGHGRGPRWITFVSNLKPSTHGGIRSAFHFSNWKKRISPRKVSATNCMRTASQRSSTVCSTWMKTGC